MGLYAEGVVSQSPGLRGSASYPGSIGTKMIYAEGVASKQVMQPYRGNRGLSGSARQASQSIVLSDTTNTAQGFFSWRVPDNVPPLAAEALIWMPSLTHFPSTSFKPPRSPLYLKLSPFASPSMS